MADNSESKFLLVVAPGFESVLREEALERGFKATGLVAGGVEVQGGWPEIWRANLELRGASRVLARLGSFPAFHLAQLDKRARTFPWAQYFRTDVPLKVEASCSKSKIYHSGAAKERIEGAIRETLCAPVDAAADVVVKVRIASDICTISVDTSGEGLHKRGHKAATGKAPMRESLAALFLRQSGYAGHETVVDPMCGSGTLIIEAAEIAAGLKPGRDRTFAFERLATFNPKIWTKLKNRDVRDGTALQFFGSDRDAGAIATCARNAAKAGVAGNVSFRHQAISDLVPPPGPPGLVIVNPPYGIRIGDKGELRRLYGAFGAVMRERFAGWRAALITSDAALARSTGLGFASDFPPVLHGGIRVRLYLIEHLN